MIIYFSGTGNARLLAERLAEMLGDEMLDLGTLLRGDAKAFKSEKPFVVMSPIHAWGIPNEVVDFLSKCSFEGNKNVYFGLTMGANNGGMSKRLRALSQKLGLVYRGCAAFVMPNNYFMGEKLESDDEALASIRKSLEELPSFAAAIKEEKDLAWDHPEREGGALLRLVAPFIHTMYGKYGKRGYHFSVSDKCIKCLRCVTSCPMENITLSDGKITFGKRCMLCLRCVSVCPVEAVDVNGKAKDNGILHLDKLIKKL